jgi:pimeloyl-ACP methyl ester carboxylesterase
MLTVASRDGTRIAFWRSGVGPPLLLVHGATADHSTTWRFVLPQLEKRFTVYVMDRRGRGASGDSPDYHLHREAEDIAAVVDSVGEPVSVVGHSYGGLCALEASLLTDNLRRLVLYEAVPLRGADCYQKAAIDRLDGLLRSGDLEAMLVALLSDIVEMPVEEIELLRSQKDAWAVRIANAPSVTRELKSEYEFVFLPARFQRLRTPTLLLVGGDSPPREMSNARGVADALLDARLVVMPGQQHVATYTAPGLFVSEIVSFLES